MNKSLGPDEWQSFFVPPIMTRLLPQSRKPKQYQRLHDSDGTVYDPDTGLPVAREPKERSWEAVRTWQNLTPVLTDNPMIGQMPPGGSGEFVKIGDAADGQFCWAQRHKIKGYVEQNRERGKDQDDGTA